MGLFSKSVLQHRSHNPMLINSVNEKDNANAIDKPTIAYLRIREEREDSEGERGRECEGEIRKRRKRRQRGGKCEEGKRIVADAHSYYVTFKKGKILVYVNNN